MIRPTISIVTPSFQQSAYLETAIRSVLYQDYPASEYYVIDGASSDGSVEIIRKYENRLSGWISEKDRGQADAINKGFSRCSGDIFGWINSDDFYLSNTFSAVADFFASHPDTDLVYGDVLSLDGYGKLLNVMSFADYDMNDLMTFRIISQPAVFFRRTAWEKAGGLDLDYHYLLDHHLWLRIASRGKIAYAHSLWSAARFYAEAKNRAHAADFGREALRLVEWMENDPLLRQAYQRNQRRIRGGAAWLDANYLSNGGMAWKAVSRYWNAFCSYPERVLEDRRRLALTLLMAVAPKKAAAIFEKKSINRLAKMKSFQKILEDELIRLSLSRD